MQITDLRVAGFRNFREVHAQPGPGANILYGRNGSGKTNLLEAIMVVLLGRSQRGAGDTVLLNAEADYYRVVATINGQGYEHEVAVAMERRGRKRITVDGVSSRAAELYDHFSAVAVGPEDIEIPAGSPSVRRRFLDMYLSQYRQGYLADLSDYHKCLSQRNAALKNKYDTQAFDDVLIPLGARVMCHRHQFIELLNPISSEHYTAIAAGERLSLAYEPSIDLPEEMSTESVAEAFRDTLLVNADRERIIGLSLFGPQRDDIRIQIAGYPSRTHGSQGQLRSAAVSMKLGVYNLLREKRDRPPVLLLDEVFAELDEERTERLIDAFGEFGQVFLTTAAQPPAKLLSQAVAFRIDQGRIEEVDR